MAAIQAPRIMALCLSSRMAGSAMVTMRGDVKGACLVDRARLSAPSGVRSDLRGSPPGSKTRSREQHAS